jgi:hypothetical protein
MFCKPMHCTSQVVKISEGQEKYLMGVQNHSRGVLHGSYEISLPCGVPQELFCMAKIRYSEEQEWFSQG